MVVKATAQKYAYWDNSLHFPVDPNLRTICNRDSFEADLGFYSSSDNAVLLIEETENPAPEKKDQLLAYVCVDRSVLATTFRVDALAYLDVGFVSPLDTRAGSLQIVNNIRNSHRARFNRTAGLASHYYTTTYRFARNAGRYACPSLEGALGGEVQTTRVHFIEILKTAPPLSMVQFVILKAVTDTDYLSRGDGHIGLDDLMKWLASRGLTDRNRWKQMLAVGGEVGIFEGVDVDSLSATIAYSLTHPRGVAAMSRFLNDPIAWAKTPMDKDQRLLSDFQRQGEEEPEGEDEADVIGPPG